MRPAGLPRSGGGRRHLPVRDWRGRRRRPHRQPARLDGQLPKPAPARGVTAPLRRARVGKLPCLGDHGRRLRERHIGAARPPRHAQDGRRRATYDGKAGAQPRGVTPRAAVDATAEGPPEAPHPSRGDRESFSLFAVPKARRAAQRPASAAARSPGGGSAPFMAGAPRSSWRAARGGALRDPCCDSSPPPARSPRCRRRSAGRGPRPARARGGACAGRPSAWCRRGPSEPVPARRRR